MRFTRRAATSRPSAAAPRPASPVPKTALETVRVPLLRRSRVTRIAAASTLLAFAFGGVVDLDPFSLQLWSAQAAALKAAAPGETASDVREDALDVLARQSAAEQVAAAATSAAEARDLGGAGSTLPAVGVPEKDQGPAPSARDLAITTAQLQALRTGKAVTVAALTTETSLTSAQPDGTLSTQASLGPLRYRTDGGSGADETGKATWADLDLTLSGQDATGRTTAEAAGPWTARLAEESGAGMVAVGPAGQTITWSPQAAAGPVGTGGPGGVLPVVAATAPTAGVTPVTTGVDLQVPPADDTPVPGQGADAPAPVVTPTITSTPTPTAKSSSAASSSSSTAASRATSSAAATAAAGVGDGEVGSDAVFPDVLTGGRDFTVSATATGAEESVLIASRAEVTAAGGAKAAAVYRNTFTLPAGVTVRQAPADAGVDPTTLGVQFLDATGAVIATFGGGKAFDTSSNEVGEPATTPVATRLLATTPSPATGSDTGSGAGSSTGPGTGTGSATVEVSVDPAWVADGARVFPLTIDPHIATGTSFSGSTGANGSNNVDAYVDEANPTVNEGVQDSGRLLAGYRPINGANKASTTLAYFNLGDLIGSENTITSAQFSLWNNYSYSCTPTGLWVDAATASWNPATVTWNTRPGWANAGPMKTFAHGYSSSCPAAAEFYDVTGIVQKWSNGTAGYSAGLPNYGFIITANGSDVAGYKRFNSAETGSGMPGLTVSWENCTNYSATGGGTKKVCGLIRDNFAAHGAVAGYGTPSTDETSTPDGSGRYNHFSLGGDVRSIYYSAPTGAHNIQGSIRSVWANSGWEAGPMGYPASDELSTPSGNGKYNHFAKAGSSTVYSIYYTPTTGAHEVHGLIRNAWADLGWETKTGYPTQDTVALSGSGGSGEVSYFTAVGADGKDWGSTGIYFKSGAARAFSVHGRIYKVYQDLGTSNSWLGYPTSDEYHPTFTPGGGAAPADAKQSDFENGVIYGDPRNGYTAVLKTGAAKMLAPQIDQHTARRLPVEFSIPKAAPGATDWPSRLSAPQLQYRRGAKAATGTSSAQLGSVWTAVPAADVRRVDGSSVATTSLPTKLDAGGNEVLDDGAGRSRLYWDAATTLKGVGGVVDVRFLFTDSLSGQQIALAPAGGVEYDPDAGQSGTAAVGPGSVNLLTGALELSDTDASAFGISITRTANSRRTNAGLQDVAGSAFGPQWVLGGVDDDLDLDYTSIRQTSDYSLDVVDASGETTSFVVDDTGSTWYPENGSEDLTLAPVGASAQNPFSATSWTLTDDDGAVTTFASPATVPAPAGVLTSAATTNGMQATWQVASMVPAATGDEAGQRNATRYHYASIAVADPVTGKTVTKMRLDRVGAANPALSATQQADCVNTTATPGLGCRVLALTWAVPLGMANEAKNARVTQVDLWAGDPASATETKTMLTTYGYDTSGQLTSVTDPRVTPALTTTYTYGAAESASVRSYTSSLDYTTSGTVTVPGRVLTVMPAGQKAWTLRYGQAGPAYDRDLAGSAGRLLRVTRPTLSAGSTDTESGTAAWNVVYDVALDTTAYGPYPMSPAALLTWGQDTPATDATAVFGPTAGTDARLDDWTGSDDTNSASARNWSTAAVSYMDVNGYTVDSAAPSSAAGKWVSSGSASASDSLGATVASGDSTRNGAGQAAANGTSGSNPAAGVTAIPVKGARIAATLVDDFGNPTMSLTAANRALALGQDDPAVVAVGGPSAQDTLSGLSTSTLNVAQAATWQRAQLLSTQIRWDASETAQNGPQAAAPARLAVNSAQPLRLTQTQPNASGSATAVPARSVTLTTYDYGRLAGATTQNLPTQVRTGFASGAELTAATVSVRFKDSAGAWQTRSDPAVYAGVSNVRTASLLRAQDAPVHDIRYTDTEYAWNGAAAGQVTRVVTRSDVGPVQASTDTRTSYDVFGRPITVTMPSSTSSSAASTTLTRYYGADGSSFGTNNCTGTNAVVFAGMVCSTGPATVSGVGTPGLPTSTTTYTRTGQSAMVTETLAGVTLRTTSTGYDGADRAISTSVVTAAASGVIAGSERKTVAYDEAGNPTSTTDNNNTTPATSWANKTTAVFDTLGRVMTSTDATGLQSSTRYDVAGRVAATTVSDLNTTGVGGGNPLTRGKAWTSTNTYDPVTGDLIATTDEAPSGQASTGTATMSLDLDGRTVATSYPGAAGVLRKRTLYDTTGAAVRRTVTAGATTILDEADAGTLTSLGGGENAHGQQIESLQTLKAIPLGIDGQPIGTTATLVRDDTRHRRYSYDSLGRLVIAADLRVPAGSSATVCTVRGWFYDANSNQVSKSSAIAGGNSCQASAYPVPLPSGQRSYNALDQITTAEDGGTYSYDGLGRTLTVPAAHLPGAPGVAMNLTYAPGDMIATQTLGSGASAETQSFTLDPTGDRVLSTTTTLPATGDGSGSGAGSNAASTTTITNRYNDSDDNPMLVNEADGSVSRYVTGPDADLAARTVVKADGTSGLEWQVANLHGDLVATLPDAAGVAAVATAATDEFGNLLDTASGRNNTPASRYDYLGAKQRSTNTRAGLTLMGVRLYDPVTGRFLSVDPVEGGSANAYSYPTDPVGSFDLDGKVWWRKALKYGAIGAGIIGAVACGASIVCGVAVGAAAGAGAYAAMRAGTSKFRWKGLAGSALVGGIGGGSYGVVGKILGTSMKGARFGLTFNSRGGRGTNLIIRGKRVFSLHSHRMPNQPAWKAIHYHRRPSERFGPGNIGEHRPWQKNGW